jgi:hypothetical protein
MTLLLRRQLKMLIVTSLRRARATERRLCRVQNTIRLSSTPPGARRRRCYGIVVACRCDPVRGALGFDAASRRQARPRTPTARRPRRHRADDGRRTRASAFRLRGFGVPCERPGRYYGSSKSRHSPRHDGASRGRPDTRAMAIAFMCRVLVFRWVAVLGHIDYRRSIRWNRPAQGAFLRHSHGGRTACASR